MELANAPFAFWIFAAVLTALAVLSAIWPLGKSDRAARRAGDGEGTKRVLTDQLEEIERDRERGLLGEEEATIARAEVGRRLLALQREERDAAKPGAASGHQVYRWATILLIPIVALGVYALSGAPNLPDQPIASRLDQPPEEQDMATLIGRVESFLQENPEDAKGWQTLAPIYQRLQRFDDAENAYRRALDIGGFEAVERATLQNGLGQVLSVKAGGQVTDEALGFFRQGQANNPADPTGFFFEAIALSRKGERVEAIAAWEHLINQFGEGNPPWLPVAVQTLAQLRASTAPEAPAASVEGATEAERGPSAEDVENAQNLSEAERTEMILSMVEGLASRLDESPDDLPGWRRLIRAYMVLGRREEAVDALAKARDTFADNTDAMEALSATANEFNL